MGLLDHVRMTCMLQLDVDVRLLHSCMRRRVVPAPKLDASVLPKLDFVCISHNHFDHLDLGTVTRLHAMYGCSVTW